MKAAGIARAIAFVAAIGAYQFAAHHAAATPGEHALGLSLVLAPLLIAALSGAWRSANRAWLLPLWALVCALLWTLRDPLMRHFGWGLFAEHEATHLALAWLFGRTLRPGREALCTRLAKMVDGPLTPPVVRYTRRVTLAWTLFFIGVALVSAGLFLFASLAAWSVFANYVVLPLVGVMFVAEHACRRFALPGRRRSSIAAAIRAYHASHAPRASDTPRGTRAQ